MVKEKDKERDLEVERQELLKFMKKSIPKDLKKRIDHAVSISTQISKYKITTSKIGAKDADSE